MLLVHEDESEGGVEYCRSFDLNDDRWNDSLISYKIGTSLNKIDIYGQVLYTGNDFCIRQN